MAQGFAISKHTAQPELCAELIAFLVSDSEAVRLLGTERGIPLNPYVSVDYGCGLNYHANKWKYTAGADYTINKQHKIDCFYRFTHEDGEDDPDGHMIGIGYKYSF